MASAKQITQNIVLRDDAVVLKGVTVEGRSQIVKDDNVTYIPTKRQVDGANSGVTLLYNMMIPKLDVNRITGEVKSKDNSTVSFYIDGRKTDKAEVDGLRPKDIAKVEYYDRPSDKFPDESTNKVVNYVKREYDYGGYVDLQTDTRFLYSTGSYKAQASFDHKKMNYTIVAGTKLSKDTEVGDESTENYALSDGFMKNTIPSDKLLKDRTYYGQFRSTYKSGATRIFFQAGLNWNEIPDNRATSTVSYTPGLYPQSTSLETQSSRNISPNIKAYYYTKSGSSTMWGSLSYTYGKNKYNRSYVEGSDDPILSDTHERTHYIDARLSYNQNLKHNNSFGVFVWGMYNKSNTEYRASTSPNQKIESFGFQLLPSYSQTIAKKLSIYLQPGFYIDKYKLNESKSITKILPRPIISLNYNINETSNLSLFTAIGTNEPAMSIYNATEQQVNQYEVMRGNPDLSIIKIYMGNLSYNLTLKNFSMSVYANYNGYSDITTAKYNVENGMMVHTYMTDGEFHDFMFGISPSVFLFNKSLQLKGGVKYSHQIIKNLYSTNNHRFS